MILNPSRSGSDFVASVPLRLWQIRKFTDQTQVGEDPKTTG